MSRRALWLIPVAAALAYGVLVGWFAPKLAAASSGLSPFDLRIGGYGEAEATAFLSALSPEGRALYLGPVRINDTLFPILFTLSLILPLRRRGWIWGAPALAYGVLDLAENAAIATLLRAGLPVDAGQVALASGLTQTKFTAVFVAGVISVWTLWRNLRRSDGGGAG